MGRCGLGGVKGHIKAFEKVKQGGASCKIDAGETVITIMDSDSHVPIFHIQSHNGVILESV